MTYGEFSVPNNNFKLLIMDFPTLFLFSSEEEQIIRAETLTRAILFPAPIVLEWICVEDQMSWLFLTSAPFSSHEWLGLLMGLGSSAT